MAKRQIAYFPGPGILDQVMVGSDYGTRDQASFRITLWNDGSLSLNCESGALSMQLPASREELTALRSMLDAALTCEVLEAA